MTEPHPPVDVKGAVAFTRGAAIRNAATQHAIGIPDRGSSLDLPHEGNVELDILVESMDAMGLTGC